MIILIILLSVIIILLMIFGINIVGSLSNIHDAIRDQTDVLSGRQFRRK